MWITFKKGRGFIPRPSTLISNQGFDASKTLISPATVLDCHGSIASDRLGVKCMYMPYTNNPNLPRVRMEAVELVQQGKSVRETARHFGFAHYI